MYRVIIASKQTTKDYKEELRQLPRGQVISVEPQGFRYVKLHTTPSYRTKGERDYFFAINKDGEFVDSNNRVSPNVHIEVIDGINERIQEYPNDYRLIGVLNHQDMIQKLRDIQRK